MNNFTLTLKSSNVKVGAIPVSMSNSSTCPSSCPFKNNGCYAAQGPLNFIWQALDRGFMKRGKEKFSYGTSWKEFIKNVQSLPKGVFWRHNIAGDLAGKDNRINKRMLESLVKVNKGKLGYTYSHKPVLDEQSKFASNNREYIKQANKRGFTINLSGNNLIHADKLKALNIAPVVAVVAHDFKGEKGLTPEGNRFIVCPAQTREKTTCSSCQLCSKQRNIIVAFKAHGTSYKKIEKTI